MRLYEIAIPFIADWEGLKLHPYYCSGKVLTIGYGEVIKNNKMYGRYSGKQLKVICEPIRKSNSRRRANVLIKAKIGTLITREEAERDFQESLREDYWYRMREYLPQGLSDNQCAALLSFAYNCGVGALEGSTLMRKLKDGNVGGAANEFLRWNRAGGRVVRGLTRRRQSEKSLFLKP